jgi:hypothetical protein
MGILMMQASVAERSLNHVSQIFFKSKSKLTIKGSKNLNRDICYSVADNLRSDSPRRWR